MSWSSIWSTVSWAQHCLLDWPASRWPRTRLACYRAAVLERHLVDGELGPALSPRDLSDAALDPIQPRTFAVGMPRKSLK